MSVKPQNSANFLQGGLAIKENTILIVFQITVPILFKSLEEQANNFFSKGVKSVTYSSVKLAFIFCLNIFHLSQTFYFCKHCKLRYSVIIEMLMADLYQYRFIMKCIVRTTTRTSVLNIRPHVLFQMWSFNRDFS